MKRGILPIDEALRLYGDMSLAEIVDEAIKHGLIPLPLQLTADELEARPQRTDQILLSCQNYLAS